MIYSDGQESAAGDHVRIDRDHTGIVVVDIDHASAVSGHAAPDWAYLEKGVLINTSFAGLVHYTDVANENIVLEKRGNAP